MEVILRAEAVESAQAGDQCEFTGTLIVVPDIGSLSMPGWFFLWSVLLYNKLLMSIEQLVQQSIPKYVMYLNVFIITFKNLSEFWNMAIWQILKGIVSLNQL